VNKLSMPAQGDAGKLGIGAGLRDAFPPVPLTDQEREVARQRIEQAMSQGRLRRG